MAATTVNLDDDAAAVLPDATSWGASPVTARPTNHAGTDVFPAPAPAVSAATTLSTFDGTNPNGTWELYAVDDAMGEVGSISGGWCLTIDAATAVATSTTIASNDNPSLTGDPVTFTATVTSSGSPVTAGTVTFREGATVLAGPTALNAAGQATFTTSTLTEGAHVITADFNGTATAGPSTVSVTQVVDNPTVVTNHRYCNAGAVTINAAGAATPFPSRIFVAGAGPAVSVTATLANVSHPLPDDVDVMLRAPNGDNLVLVADAGGTTPVSGVTVTFDDAAATGLPDTGGWGVSPVTADPTNHAPGDTWPAPAPAPSAATTLGVF